MDCGNTLLDDHVLSLTGVQRPSVCFLPTASGDADHYIVRFYRAFAHARCQPSHISLFRRATGVGDPRAHLLEQDLVYVGGGSLVSMLATWRAHGIDTALRDAWRAGVVLCGGSAGSLCWFSHVVSAFHEGPARRMMGLGFLPWSNAVHYEDEPGRRGAFHDAVADGMPSGYGACDGAALHFLGTELAEVICSHPGARAVHVSRGDGDVLERELPGRYLGEVGTPPAMSGAGGGKGVIAADGEGAVIAA